MDSATIDRRIAETLGMWLAPPTAYPGTLPPDLAPWHCYATDGGHSIVVAVASRYRPDLPPGEYLCGVPVRTVLRLGWTLTAEGYVLCDVPYSSDLGAMVDPADEEM